MTNQDTIQINNENTDLYEDTGRYLTTISTTRLKWLWQQYNKAMDSSHNLVPPTQPFEKEVIWLYQRYKIKTPKNNSQNITHHTLPTNILEQITFAFDITHSYFSSPITYPIQISEFHSPFARDKVFGSRGTAFQYKWKGIGYAHPHNKETAQQAIHWARLAAKTDPNTITILVIPDTNWYHNPSPYIGPFPDTHIITHFSADSVTYDIPTPPPKYKPETEPLAIQIMCIHHQNHNIGTPQQINNIKTAIDSLQILNYHLQIAPPTPHNTPVNKNKLWNKLIYPPPINTSSLNTPPLPAFTSTSTLKFQPQYSYYTDGSFIPPTEAPDGHWKKEKAGYGIYNATKPDMQISERLPGLQTPFCAELMAIHTTLSLLATKYPNEPAYIFTDCINCLYNLNTHILHPSTHNNHADKTILTEMVDLLKSRTQPTIFYKVKAHINITGNEEADKLAKEGAVKRYSIATRLHEFAHTTPFYFHKYEWPGPEKRPDKGSVRCLQTYLHDYDRTKNIETLANDFPNIKKWTTNPDIDNELSN
ncbi:MAG TPA: RNase H family protein, partial [Candidatus Nitrosocosmicus sp.]|nr:RNase H family protein [Candidatus Nitrosocosmicus sp.]